MGRCVSVRPVGKRVVSCPTPAIPCRPPSHRRTSHDRTRRKSKESSHSRQGGAKFFFRPPPFSSPAQRIVSQLAVVRRNNAVTLFQQFAEAQMRAGVAPKGLEQ